MQQALQYLTARLKDRKNYQIQIDVLRKIARLQTPQATDFLLALLEEPQINISNKIRVLCVLPETKDARFADVIWSYASQEFPPPIRIMELLGEYQERRAVPLLIKALSTKGLYAGERITAAIALGNIGDERAVPALVEALADDRTFVGFERVWIPKNIPLSSYALKALKTINTQTAQRAIQTWEKRYDERAQARVEKVIQLMNNHQYVRWQHNEDLLRLGHYAIDVINTLTLHQGKKLKRALSQIFIGMNKSPEMIPENAKAKILNFVLSEFERTEHSIFTPSFFDVIAHFDDARIDEFALDAITRHTVALKQAQLLGLIGHRKLHQAIPIIQDMIDGVIVYEGKRLALFKVLADIGGAEAKQLIRERIGAEDFAIKKGFLEAYANLHCGTDDALHLIDELINHRDNYVQIRAIKSLAKGGNGSFYVLLSLLSSTRIQQSAVLSALCDCADDRALPYLIKQLKGKRLGQDIRKAFVHIGTENAYAILNAWDAPDDDLPILG